MKRSELRLLWQSRIEAFQLSGETSVTIWCAKQGISVPSMYQWLRKSRVQSETSPAQWLPVVMQEPVPVEIMPITLKVNGVAIECPPDFDEATLTKILQVVQHHVYYIN